MLGRDLEGKDSGEVREKKPTGDRSWESVLQEKAGAGRGNEILLQQLFQEARKGLDSRVGDKVCHLPSPSCR